MYGSDTISAFELRKGVTKLLHPEGVLKHIPHHIVKAYDTLLAKRSRNLIIRSQLTTNSSVSSRALMQVYVCIEN